MTGAVEAYLGVGSNIDAEANLRAGMKALRDRFALLRLSRVYQNPAVGFVGEDFYNLAVKIRTDLDVWSLLPELRHIEERCGRDRAAPKHSDRTLDIDLLMYGDMNCDEPGLCLPRPDICRHAFVLGPLAEVAGDKVHGAAGKTIGQLWQEFASDHRLRPVAMDLGSPFQK